MKRRSFFRPSYIVMDRYLERVSPICRQQRAREGAIDQKSTLGNPIRSNGAARNSQVISPRHASAWGISIRVGIPNRGVSPRESCWWSLERISNDNTTIMTSRWK